MATGEEFMPDSDSGVLAAIEKSSDTKWLEQCREYNANIGRQNVAAAAKQRILDVNLSKALRVMLGEKTLEGRIAESLRVYREILKHKHGRNQAAGYTEREIRDYGPKQALIRTIRRGKKTEGLKTLQFHERLDCSYEQIAIDFATELPDDVVDQAKATLAQLASSG